MPRPPSEPELVPEVAPELPLDPEAPPAEDPELDPELDPEPAPDPDDPPAEDAELAAEPELDPVEDPELDPELAPEGPGEVAPELLDEPGFTPPFAAAPEESAGDEQALAIDAAAPNATHPMVLEKDNAPPCVITSNTRPADC